MDAVCVDWDGTLVDREQQWLPGATVALQSLTGLGYRAVVHSCRANWPEGRRLIDETLAAAGLDRQVRVHDGAGKPNARFYIDDRAIRFDGDWPSVIRQLQGLPS